MLESRVIATLKFYDLQDMALTAFEVYKYLLAEKEVMLSKLDDRYELLPGTNEPASRALGFDTILASLNSLEQEGKIASRKGYFHLPGREALVELRLVNYFYGLRRERYLNRFLPIVRHLPFVRGVALGGSQAFGLNRPTSDIDLLVITHPQFMWLCRTLMSAYFQIIGLRRHGKKIANRFCLNHYLSNIREVDAERNLYKAMEYSRLRPLIYAQQIVAFQSVNLTWINIFMPNFRPPGVNTSHSTWAQKTAEKLFSNRLGYKLEQWLERWQSARIRQDQFVFIRTDELSFHPESKHEQLLGQFFS